jgi:hypothetical protein
MAENIDDVNEMSELLRILGVDTVVKSENPIDNTRAAVRRYSAELIEQAYSNAVKKTGSELEYSSAKHLVTGIFGLLPDVINTLWEPIKDVIESPVVSELISEKTNGGDLMDYFASLGSKNESLNELETSTQELRDSTKTIQRSNDYVKEIADHCQKTGKSPDEVLRSKEDMVGIVRTVYGSVSEYEKIQVKSIQELSKLVNKFDELQKMPFGLIIPALITSKMDGINDLSEIGVNPSEIGNIVHSYMSDVGKFGKTLLTEYAKVTTKEIQAYKALDM